MAPWTGRGFADHHCHLLHGAAKVVAAGSEDVQSWHRALALRESSPTDEHWETTVAAQDLPQALLHALNEAASLGLVEITEAWLFDWGIWNALLGLRGHNPLPARVKVLLSSGLAERTGVKAIRSRMTGDDQAEISGVKFYSDGWLGAHTCALREPFADLPVESGTLFFDSTTLARRAEPFAAAGLTVATHAIGDRAIESVLGAYERLFDTPQDCRAAAPRIEHVQVLHPDLITRMAEWGVVACIQPSFGVDDAPIATAALGKERMRDAYRWTALVDAGVPVITGSDYSIGALSPLIGLQHLVTGAAVDAPDEVVTHQMPLDTALDLMTSDIGTVTLSDDPREVDPGAIHQIEVLDTSSPRA